VGGDSRRESEVPATRRGSMLVRGDYAGGGGGDDSSRANRGSRAGGLVRYTGARDLGSRGKVRYK